MYSDKGEQPMGLALSEESGCETEAGTATDIGARGCLWPPLEDLFVRHLGVNTSLRASTTASRRRQTERWM